jgi:creatinine amidohydrolase/Fe(II)-dependent formamide hydrolase-like protein
VVGNPKGVDAETGELEIRAMVDQLALALEEFATLEFMS